GGGRGLRGALGPRGAGRAVVRADRARPDQSPHARPAPCRDRAGRPRGVHRLPLPLAAGRPRRPPPRRRRAPGSPGPAPGARTPRLRVGAPPPPPPPPRPPPRAPPPPHPISPSP